MNSLYLGTEGEGVFVGHPQVFVRLQGCAVGCLNCDSVDTWEFDVLEPVGVGEVAGEVARLGRGVRRVSVTGGDPLHPRHVPAVLELVRRLKEGGYWVNIEASGTRVVEDIFGLVDFVSFDVKTPSTGVPFRREPLDGFIAGYGDQGQIKSVVETEEDFRFVLRLYQETVVDAAHGDIPWVLTPSYLPGESWPGERVKMVVSLNEQNGGPFRVVCQQHKLIHGPDRRKSEEVLNKREKISIRVTGRRFFRLIKALA